MKKLLLIGILVALSGMTLAQSTMKVKTIKETTKISSSVGSTIEVDYPASSSASLNSKILKFIVSIMDVSRYAGWTNDASKPKLQITDMPTFRKFTKEYTRTIANQGKKYAAEEASYSEAEEEDIYVVKNHELTIKMKAQGNKFICYELLNEAIDNNFVIYSKDYYIVKKSDGKPVKQVIKSQYKKQFYNLLSKNVERDAKYVFLESVPEEAVAYATCFWMDSRWIHFYYSDDEETDTWFDIKLPLSQVRQYLTDEMKALIK